jgi:hypothetical protein
MFGRSQAYSDQQDPPGAWYTEPLIRATRCQCRATDLPPSVKVHERPADAEFCDTGDLDLAACAEHAGALLSPQRTLTSAGIQSASSDMHGCSTFAGVVRYTTSHPETAVTRLPTPPVDSGTLRSASPTRPLTMQPEGLPQIMSATAFGHGEYYSTKRYTWHHAPDWQIPTYVLCTHNCPDPTARVPVASCRAQANFKWRGLTGALRPLTFQEFVEYSSTHPLTTVSVAGADIADGPRWRTVDHAGIEVDLEARRTLPACVVDADSFGFCGRQNAGHVISCSGRYPSTTAPHLRCCSRYRDGASSFPWSHTRRVQIRSRRWFVYQQEVSERVFLSRCYSSSAPGVSSTVRHSGLDPSCKIVDPVVWEQFTVLPTTAVALYGLNVSLASQARSTHTDVPVGATLSAGATKSFGWNGPQYWSYDDQAGTSTATDCQVDESHFVYSGGVSLCHFQAHSCPAVPGPAGHPDLCARTEMGQVCTVAVPAGHLCTTEAATCVSGGTDGQSGVYTHNVTCTPTVSARTPIDVQHRTILPGQVVYIQAHSNGWMYHDPGNNSYVYTDGVCPRLQRTRTDSVLNNPCDHSQFAIDRLSTDTPEGRPLGSGAGTANRVRVRIRSISHNTALHCLQGSDGQPCRMVPLTEDPDDPQWLWMDAYSTSALEAGTVNPINSTTSVSFRAPDESLDYHLQCPTTPQHEHDAPCRLRPRGDATKFTVHVGVPWTGRRVCTGSTPAYFPLRAMDETPDAGGSYQVCPAGYREITTHAECERAGLAAWSPDVRASATALRPEISAFEISDPGAQWTSGAETVLLVVAASSRVRCAETCHVHQDCRAIHYDESDHNCSMYTVYAQSTLLGRVPVDVVTSKLPVPLVSAPDRTWWATPPGCSLVRHHATMHGDPDAIEAAHWELQFNDIRNLLSWNRPDTVSHELDERVLATPLSRPECTPGVPSELGLHECRTLLVDPAHRSQAAMSLGLAARFSNLTFADRIDHCLMNQCAPMVGCSIGYDPRVHTVNVFFALTTTQLAPPAENAQGVLPWCGGCPGLTEPECLQILTSPHVGHAVRAQLGLLAQAAVIPANPDSQVDHVRGCTVMPRPISAIHPHGAVEVHWQGVAASVNGFAATTSLLSDRKALSWCGLDHQRVGISRYRRLCARGAPSVWRTADPTRLPRGRGPATAVITADRVHYRRSAEHGTPCPSGYLSIQTLTQCVAATVALGITANSGKPLAIISDVRTVPGCFQDSPLALSSTHPSPSTIDATWTGFVAGVRVSQIGTGVGAFNERTTRDADDFERLELQRAHGWARGRLICVAAAQVQPQWVLIPVYTTTLARQLDHVHRTDHGSLQDACDVACFRNPQCAQVSYSAHNATCVQHHQAGTARSEHLLDWVVRRPKYIRLSDEGQLCPATYRAIGSYAQCRDAFDHVAYSDSGDFSIPVQKQWTAPSDFVRSSNGRASAEFLAGCVLLPGPSTPYTVALKFDWQQQYYTLNPRSLDPAPTTGHTALRGYSVCVDTAHHQQPEPDLPRFLQVVQSVDSEPTVQFTPAVTDNVVLTVEIWMIGLGATSITGALEAILVETTRTVCGVQGGVATVVPLSDISATLRLQVTVPRAHLDDIQATLVASIRSSQSAPRPSFLVRASAYELARTGQQDAVRIIDVGLAHFAHTNLPGSYMLSGPVDVDVRTSTVPNRRLYWQADCSCMSQTGECDPARDLDLFEFRTPLHPMEWDGLRHSFADAHTSDACFEACKASLTCMVVAHAETAVPGTERCGYYLDMGVLALMPVDPTSNLRVRVKTNACPPVRITNPSICYDSDTETGECVDVAANHLSARVHFGESAATAGFVYRPVLGPGFALGAVSANASATALCWTHSDLRSDLARVLCADGSYEPMALTGTHDCTDPDRVNGTHASARARCPPAAPHMCRYIHSGDTDHRCATTLTGCLEHGGARPCGYGHYDLAGVPAFETLPIDPLATAITHRLSNDEDTQLLIDSASRCGGSFVDDVHATHVLFGQLNCSTGFACCNQSGPLLATHCQCPRLASPEHLAVHGGAFDGACHLPVSTWPACVRECAEAGEDCQYYLRHRDTERCLLCYAGTDVSATSDWEHHLPRVPTYMDSAAGFRSNVSSAGCANGQADPGCGYTFAAHTGSLLVGDATARTEGDWYAHATDTGTSQCPPGYDVSQERAHCQRAALSFHRHTRGRLSNAGASYASTMTESSPCDCARPVGCSVVPTPTNLQIHYRNQDDCNCTTYAAPAPAPFTLVEVPAPAPSAQQADVTVCLYTGSTRLLAASGFSGHSAAAVSVHHDVVRYTTSDCASLPGDWVPLSKQLCYVVASGRVQPGEGETCSPVGGTFADGGNTTLLRALCRAGLGLAPESTLYDSTDLSPSTVAPGCRWASHGTRYLPFLDHSSATGGVDGPTRTPSRAPTVAPTFMEQIVTRHTAVHEGCTWELADSRECSHGFVHATTISDCQTGAALFGKSFSSAAGNIVASDRFVRGCQEVVTVGSSTGRSGQFYLNNHASPSRWATGYPVCKHCEPTQSGRRLLDTGPSTQATTTTPPAPRLVCRQSPRSKETVSAQWRLCSERCSTEPRCEHWAWNMESHRCVITRGSAASESQFLRLRSLTSVGHAAPFGDNWLSGIRADNPKERGEGAFAVARLQLYRLALGPGALAYKHMLLTRQSHETTPGDVEQGAASSPGEYMVVGLPGSQADSSRFATQAISAQYTSVGSLTWRAVPYHYPVDSPDRRLGVDRSCWHNSLQDQDPSADIPAHLLECAVLGPASRDPGCRDPRHPTSEQLTHWNGYGATDLLLAAWIRPASTDVVGDRAVFGTEYRTLQDKVPSLTYVGDLQRLRLVYWTPGDGQDVPLHLVRVLLEVRIPPERWNHVTVFVTARSSVRVYLNGHAVNLYGATGAYETPAVVVKRATASLQTPLFDGHVVDAKFHSDAHVSVSHMDAQARTLVLDDNDQCVVKVLLDEAVPGTPRRAGWLFNPGLDLLERVASVSTQTPDRMMADATDPGQTSYEWRRSDCEVEALEHGAVYALEAVFDLKLHSPMGLFSAVANGEYVPSWLTTCQIHNRTDGRTDQQELCLRQTSDPVQWTATRSGGNTGPWELVRRSDPASRFQVDLELSTDTTFPEVYHVHADQSAGSQLRVQEQADVVLRLAGDEDVHLLTPNALACHGSCPSGYPQQLTQGDGFTIVRRFSNISVGVVHDDDDPRGLVAVTPAVFTNGSDSHLWLTDKCQRYANASGVPGQLVSLQTGRCLHHRPGTASQPAPGDSAFRYGRCDEHAASVTCWWMARASVPYELSTPGLATGTANSRTLAFDDSVLWWHNQIVAPARSNRSLFLGPNTVTDVSFNVMLYPDTASDPQANVMPIRLYTHDERPVRFPRCLGVIKSPYASGLHVPCESECFRVGSQSICNVTSQSVTVWAVCASTCVPSVGSWTDSQEAHSFDLEFEKRTVGSLLRTRAWRASDVSLPRRCVGSHLATKTAGGINTSDATPQLTSCTEAGLADHYDLVDVLSKLPGETRAHTVRHGSKLLRSLSTDTCLGLADDDTSVQMVSCTASRPSQLLYARHSLVDDADMTGRPTVVSVSAVSDALVVYRAGHASVVAVLYRRPSMGTVRVIVRMDAAGDLDPMVRTGQMDTHLVVSLVDRTARVLGSPSSHNYMARVQRTSVNSTHETVHYLLLRNGTVVDTHTRLQVPTPPVHTPNPTVRRGSISAAVARPLRGVVSRVNVLARGVGVTHLRALDDSHRRFGGGRHFRLRRTDRSVHLPNGSSTDCARACNTRQSQQGDCTAARWSEYDRVCEFVLSCKRLLTVAEGNPNSFNLRASPLYLYTRSPHPDKLHRLFDRTSDADTTDGSMRVEVMSTVTDPQVPRAMRFWDVPNLQVYPDAASISSSRALSDIDGQDIGSQTTGRRLLQTPFAAFVERWARDWWDTVPDRPLPYEYTPPAVPLPAATTATVNQTTYDMDDTFPTLLARSRQDNVDLLCTDAHTFAFVTTTKTTEARYGYRRVFSRTEDGVGGIQLVLSPDGHLKDRASNVSIAVDGVSGCLSIVVVDCFDRYRVSVDGQVRHYAPECPFDVKNTDTRVHSWSGRADVMCFGGPKRLHSNRHFELVAYFQSLYGKAPYNLCYDPESRAGYVGTPPDAGFFVLPRNRANTTANHTRRTWRVSEFSSDADSKLRCLDPAICDNDHRDVVVYKDETAPHTANPFRLAISDPHTAHGIRYAQLADSADTPNTDAVKEINWITDQAAGTQFDSQVTRESELDACHVSQDRHVVHRSAVPCGCEDHVFSPWIEDIDQSTHCGECQFTYDVQTNPQWQPTMRTQRYIGTRVPDTLTASKFSTRFVNSTDGGCPELYADASSLTTKRETIVCPQCTTDCRLDPGSVMVAPVHIQSTRARECPVSRDENVTCGGRGMRSSCDFYVKMLQQPTNGGKTCLQAAIDDLRVVIRAAAHQGAASVATSGPLAAGDAYTESEVDSLVTYGYYNSEPVVQLRMYQGPLYAAQPWDWVSEAMLPVTGPAFRLVCPDPCKAEYCVDYPLINPQSSLERFVAIQLGGITAFALVVIAVATFAIIAYYVKRPMYQRIKESTN